MPRREFFRLSFGGARSMAVSPSVPLDMRIWFAGIYRVDETGWAAFQPGELARFVSTRVDLETGEVLADRHVTNRRIGKMVDNGWLREGSSLRSLGIPEHFGAFGKAPEALTPTWRRRDRVEAERAKADAAANWDRVTTRYREPREDHPGAPEVAA